MNFTLLDWSAVVGYLLITLVLGLYFRVGRARALTITLSPAGSVSWWLAGTSMVATTFAADTPLVVTGLVYSQGDCRELVMVVVPAVGDDDRVSIRPICGGGSGLLPTCSSPRCGIRASRRRFCGDFGRIYLGLLMNCLILGWVTKAMTTIVATTLGLTDRGALMVCVFFLIPFTGLYVALGGLWGVLWTDLFQFVLKMSIVIAVAYYGVRACGGMSTLLARLAAMRASAGPNAGDATSFFPDFSRPFSSEAIWTLPALTFLVNLGLQWWAFWYPGAEPGGGGYIAQRIFSAKDERNGLLSVLWFNIAHYAVRPWPWILTALSVIVLYPRLEHPEAGYMMVVTQHVPPALRGIVVAGFMAAFMSTFATQLNWGASYLVADFYRRFLKKDGSDAHYVSVSRLATVLLVIVSAYVSAQLASIRSGWEFVLEVGAGTGGVYLLRWYWWRINAWSEISAMAMALASTVALRWWLPFSGNAPVVFAKTALATTAITTVCWIVVTLLTPAEPERVLVDFYRHVRPDVRGWKVIAQMASDVVPTRDLGRNLLCWVLGCAMVYSALFGTGWMLLGPRERGAFVLSISVVCGLALWRELTRREAKLG